MAETKSPRESISTRIDAKAREVIERVAASRRTTPAQVARVRARRRGQAIGPRDTSGIGGRNGEGR